MHNYFTLETEVAHRGYERDRMVAAAQRAQAPPGNGWTRRLRLPHLTFAYLRLRSAPRLRLPSLGNAAEGSSPPRSWNEVVPP